MQVGLDETGQVYNGNWPTTGACGVPEYQDELLGEVKADLGGGSTLAKSNRE